MGALNLIKRALIRYTLTQYRDEYLHNILILDFSTVPHARIYMRYFLEFTHSSDLIIRPYTTSLNYSQVHPVRYNFLHQFNFCVTRRAKHRSLQHTRKIGGKSGSSVDLPIGHTRFTDHRNDDVVSRTPCMKVEDAGQRGNRSWGSLEVVDSWPSKPRSTTMQLPSNIVLPPSKQPASPVFYGPAKSVWS